jgi:hypothetical protein
MAERLAPGDYDQLHHFVAAGVWDAAPLEKELLVQADKLVGGSDAVLVIDDTAVANGTLFGRHRADAFSLAGCDIIVDRLWVTDQERVARIQGPRGAAT